MKYRFAAEIDHTINGREFSKISQEVAATIDSFLRDQAPDESGLEIIYCPILMSAKNLSDYPARSRIDRRGNIVNVSPQINHESYQASNYVGRKSVYVSALRDELLRMNAVEFDERIGGLIEFLA